MEEYETANQGVKHVGVFQPLCPKLSLQLLEILQQSPFNALPWTDPSTPFIPHCSTIDRFGRPRRQFGCHSIEIALDQPSGLRRAAALLPPLEAGVHPDSLWGENYEKRHDILVPDPLVDRVRIF